MTGRMMPISNEIALQVSCPRCGAGKGEGCTYIWPHGVPRYRRTDAAVRTMEKYGKPTKSVHIQRRENAFRFLQRQYAAQYIAPPVRSHVREALKAMQAWDLNEYDRLRQWLRRYGSLLYRMEGGENGVGSLRGRLPRQRQPEGP